MLHFFRKYQKFFFAIIITVTVVTFVFYGTYQAIAPVFGQKNETSAFKTSSGKDISYVEFHTLCALLSDEDPSNFLNEGIISKEFFESGIMSLIYDHNRVAFDAESTSRIEKERKYTPYTHPQAAFVSAESVWSMYAPEMSDKLKKVQNMNVGKELFEAKMALYEAQKVLPPYFLAYMLRAQEAQYHLPEDPRLQREGIALFGYHNLADWFGKEMIESVAKLIYEGASLAQEKGYVVTQDEVRADLTARIEKFYQLARPRLPANISSPSLLFQRYVQQRGWSEETLAKVWHEWLLFHRLLNDVGSVASVDVVALNDLYQQAHQYFPVTIYQMPAALKLKNEQDLKQFEAYLLAVCGKRGDILAVPEVYDALEKVKESAPECIGNRFVLEVKSISHDQLQAKIALKECWEWEEKNFKLVQEKFPELKQKESAALATLDAKTRARVDAFAASSLLQTRTEWVKQVLNDTAAEVKEVCLNTACSQLVGMTDPQELLTLLQKQDTLICYSQDQKHFYNIAVKERKAPYILSFEEAKTLGVLEKLVAKSDLTSHLESVRAAITKEAASRKLEVPKEIASLRFLTFLNESSLHHPLWPITKVDHAVTRNDERYLSFKEASAAPTGAFCALKHDAELGLFFYQVHEMKTQEVLPLKRIMAVGEFLGNEEKVLFVKKCLMK